MKKIVILIFLMLMILSGCKKAPNPIATMTIKDYGDVIIELYPQKAYNTVANFISLAKSGFYDHNSIHRVVPKFVIQGGDPKGEGTGGPGYTIRGEFKDNGFLGNDITHTRGTISMARSIDNNSAGSQFFIVLDDGAKTSLDNKYAAFGKVISGMNIIDKMVEDAKIKDINSGKLIDNYIIEKITVETYGQKYKLHKITNN